MPSKAIMYGACGPCRFLYVTSTRSPFGAVQEQLALSSGARPRASRASTSKCSATAGIDARRRSEPDTFHGSERAVGDRQLGVGHDQLGVELERRAEAVAGRAGAVRRVEREHRAAPARAATRRARGRRTSRRRVVGSAVDDRRSRSAPSASCSAVSTESARRLRRSALMHEPVDDHRDVVLELLVEPDAPRRAGAISPSTLTRAKPSPRRSSNTSLELALAAAHDGASTVNRVPSGSAITWSTICSADWPAIGRPQIVAVRLADPGEQQAQVVVDLGDRADRRARVARRRLLVDRDRRREALDGVDVGLLHLPEELARVRREGLDVAALALGVERVEGERRLARAGQPGDADELLPGDARR